MRTLARIAMSGAILVALGAIVPNAAIAACSSAGTVSDVNDCVPAGSGGKDCFVEWSVTPVPPTDPYTGFPTKKVQCLDNDPSCDNDVTPGQCTFMVGACLNVTETRFTCTATSADSYIIKRPSLTDINKPHKNRFNRDNRKGIDEGLDGLIPTGTADVCGPETPFIVPLRSPTKSGKAQDRSADLRSAREQGHRYPGVQVPPQPGDRHPADRVGASDHDDVGADRRPARHRSRR